MKTLSAAKKKRIARAAGQVFDQAWSVSKARARVRTIADMVTALQENGFHLSDKDESVRYVAEALGVPFFIVWLAAENFVSNADIADLDDIEEGLRWLDAHGVPRDILRRKRPRHQEWQEKVGQRNAEIEKADGQSTQAG